jgi:mono/diheme cytochrome c family protein
MRMKFVLAVVVLICGLMVVMGQPASRPAVFTAAQAGAGRVAYEASCEKCHTATLVGRDGSGEIPDFLRDYAGKIPPLAGANAAFTPFMTKWGARTTQDLYTRIQDATRGFPPPDRKLSEKLGLDLTAYVLQMNGAQPGPQPLTPATVIEIRSVVK